MTRQSNVKSTRKTSNEGRVTKKEQLIKLLRTKSGADIRTLSGKLGWQEHTTRAALTGLRRAGFEILAEKPPKGGNSKYRIATEQAASATPAPEATSDAG
jgi:predicted transcriptional regulator